MVEEKDEMITEAEKPERDMTPENETGSAAAEQKKGRSSGEVKKLKSELEGVKKKLEDAEAKLSEQTAEASDKYARLAAEYDNFRKRTQKDRENIYADAVADAVMGLVPVLDNLMYAEKFGASDSPEKFAEGVKMILSRLPETLEKMNVSVFGAAGEKFDPSLHNAVMHVEDDNFGENEIVDVLQCGYKYGDRVIRYAMVKVAN